MEHEETVTAGEAAGIIGVNIATVARWAKRGVLTPTGTEGRAILYPRPMVERVAAARRVLTGAAS
ncbi:helix-turn-helix domain-containing protein [Promicromonospora sp. MEB111]|uniref:MerR family transcriptional regulator n=1 Tax=Promicromonospora sp. MEB111 TaxID=3040301 RepID=UPI00254B37D3|nr:helix-turn-helix domain-containing protein [Promicromonospora sp. MEB111]